MDEEKRDRPIEAHPVDEVGRRGGSASYAGQAPYDDYITAWAKTVVRWSPIWVGFLVALGINLVLYVLVLAATLSSRSPSAAGTGDALQTAGIWSAISTLIALFVGGFLAGRLGVQQGLRSGMVQGSVVWALFVIFAMLLSLYGLGGFVSGLAGLTNLRTITSAGSNVSAIDAQRAISNTASGLWWLFAGLVIAWIASVAGGYLGVMSARPDTDEPEQNRT